MIRAITPADLPALKTVIDACGLFPSEMLDDMIAGHFNGQTTGEPTDALWLTIDDGTPFAIAYVVPEPMTDGTSNLLLIAVHPDRQHQGHGSALTRHIEHVLSTRGVRILLVETSGLASFERTRAVYDNLGFEREARIRDFYAAGEDKIVFRKALG